MIKTVDVYCDGCCVPNPGKGSWGAVIQYPDGSTDELKGVSDEVLTTNQRMEILAAIRSLEHLSAPSDVRIFSDSKYLINCATGKWMQKVNLDLWIKLHEVRRRHRIVWVWVKGHNGNAGNERADQLAASALTPDSTEKAKLPKRRVSASNGRSNGRSKAKRKEQDQAHRSLTDYPRRLRDPGQNRWAGHETWAMRTLPGKFGAASTCRIFSEKEKRELEETLKSRKS